MKLRLLTIADIPAAQNLRAAAGWNQTDEDWRRLLEFEPQGCFAAEIDGALAGTATTTRFDSAAGPGSFAWIGMLLVSPAHRRRGIGSTLLKKCIAHLDAAGVETLKLDATALGKPLYDALGFRTEYGIERWEGTASPRGIIMTESSISSLTKSDLAELAEFDAPIFGTSRRRVLAAWWNASPNHALAARIDGTLSGYALGRAGSHFAQMGPIIGNTPGVCEALLCEALARLEGQKVVIDVPENGWSNSLVLKAGLQLQRSLIRMFRGPNHSPGRPESILAICGLEVG